MKDRNNNANKPVLSTFGGESIANDRWTQSKNKFLNSRGALDRVFNWNSWPATSEGRVLVSAATDHTFQTAAKNANKYFVMGISLLQFKHATYGNWYRRDEDNLENRIGQILNVQPDMVQLQTWNYSGESHYMGRLHQEPPDDQTKLLTNDYDHTGYWQIIPPFINAWKRGDTSTANMYPTNGKPAQGTFWHHTLTTGGSCTADQYPKPTGIETAGEDTISGIVLVAQGKPGFKAEVKVGNTRLGRDVVSLSPWFNKFKLTGLYALVPGKVQIEVWGGSTMVGGGYGKIGITRQKDICNYNF